MSLKEPEVPCIDERLVTCAETVMKKVATAGLTIVTAESCTAGLIAAALSQAEGAGSCLHGSFVTYTKAHKTAALGVPEDLLAGAGSVNREVARCMAEGALARSGADLVLALTGVLGPTEDEDGNPVGRMVFACGRRGMELLIDERYFGTMEPERLRRLAVLHAMKLLQEAVPEIRR